MAELYDKVSLGQVSDLTLLYVTCRSGPGEAAVNPSFLSRHAAGAGAGAAKHSTACPARTAG